jgi:hypothetical protein
MTIKTFGQIRVQKGKAVLHEARRALARRETWKSAYEALSNYCFPPDFRLQLRDQLTGARQRRSDVRDCHRDIEMLTV